MGTMVGLYWACRYNGATTAGETGIDQPGIVEGQACNDTAARAAARDERLRGGRPLD
jgi:hypothetical protein